MSGAEISVIRHRRTYSKAFKAQVVAECSAPQPSICHRQRGPRARPVADTLHRWLIGQRQRVPEGSGIGSRSRSGPGRRAFKMAVRGIAAGWAARGGDHEPDPVGKTQRA